MTELEELARALPDGLAWDMLAREGFLLVDVSDGTETWWRDGEEVTRARA